MGLHSNFLLYIFCVVQYLKEQRLQPQTFIPLQSVRVKPIQEKLRTLGGTAKLIYDVIQFDPALERAMLYAVGNTLVCDRLDEAKRLAWGGERHKGWSSNLRRSSCLILCILSWSLADQYTSFSSRDLV